MKFPSFPDRYYINARSGLARFNSQEGHGYKPQIDLLHFDHLLEEQTQVLTATTDLSGEELVKTARRQALIIFNTTFGQNIRSVIEEQKRKDTVSGSWEIRNGELYAEGWGTLETILERAKNENPESYNEQEAQAMLRAQEILVSDPSIGAVAYAMYHQSGTRYVPMMERVGDTVAIRSVDIGILTGRNATNEEGADIIKMLQKRHNDTTAIDTTVEDFPLLVMSKPISTREVQETTMSRVMISETNSLKREESVFTHQESFSRYTMVRSEADNRISHQELTMRIPAQLPNMVMADEATGILVQEQCWRNAEENIGRNIHKPGEYKDSVQPLPHVSVMHWDQHKSPGTSRQRNVPLVVQVRDMLRGLKEGQKRKEYNQPQRVTPVQERDTGHILKNEWEKRIKIVRTLEFITETGVGIGAVPVFLTQLTREMPKSVRAIEKSIARKKRKEARMVKRKAEKNKTHREKGKKRTELGSKGIVFVATRSWGERQRSLKKLRNISGVRKESLHREHVTKAGEKKMIRTSEMKPEPAFMLLSLIERTGAGVGILPLLWEVLRKSEKKRRIKKINTLYEKKARPPGDRIRKLKNLEAGFLPDSIMKKRRRKRLREILFAGRDKRLRTLWTKRKEMPFLLKKKKKEKAQKVNNVSVEQLLFVISQKRMQIEAHLSRSEKKVQYGMETISYERVKRKNYEAKEDVRLKGYWFFTALLLWVMLRSKRNDVEVTAQPGDMQQVYENKEHNVISETEPRVWLLFAIIWYLAQLREGRVPAPVKKKTKKKKRTKATLPPAGVIYQPAAHYV